MKITAIKQQIKNPDRVSIFIDGKYSFSLTLDQLLEQKLKKDLEIDDAKIKVLEKLSEEGKLRARTLEWLLRRPHSTRELRDYLYRKKIDKDLIEKLVLELTEKKYLNDVEFARWFAENRLRKNKSMREVTAELSSKGIDRETVSGVLDDLSASDEANRLLELIKKLRKRSRYQDQDKLVAYLQRKGFRYSDIKIAMSELD